MACARLTRAFSTFEKESKDELEVSEGNLGKQKAVLQSLPHSYSIGRAHIQLETAELTEVFKIHNSQRIPLLSAFAC